jgi:photosystem II stability/assembly factor-like uncharacterized protein
LIDRVIRHGGPGFILVLLLFATALPVFAQDHLDRSIIAPLAAGSLLLDGASRDGLAVVVGERGHVLVSRDQGRTWDQKQVPTVSLLTAVYLHDGSLGWAVGHDAVILRTRDGGETWERVYYDPEEERPLLDVWFRDELNGFAIGAYGYFLVSEDGGDTWTPQEIATVEEEEDDFYGGGFDYHLNHLSNPGEGRLFIAAEAGTVYRSDDGGENWASLPSPYEGSFFGSLPLDGDVLLLFGLRGHLYRSEDAGESWSIIPTSTTAMLTDGIRLQDGAIVVAGLSGTLLVSRDDGLTFTLIQREDRLGITSILQTEDGGLILVGEGGARRLEEL